MALTDTDVPIPRRAKTSPIQVSGWLAGLGAVVGFGALAASSCCVLPLALAGLGAGSAEFGGLEVLANWRQLLLGGAVVVVLVGWTLFFWRRSAASCVDGSCAVYTPAKSAGVYLSVATAFIAVSIIWDPYIEPVLLKLVR